MKIKVRVNPNSSDEKIKKKTEREYEVYLKKPPKNNEANLELIKILKRYFKKQVRIIRGLKSKEKIVEIN